MREIRKLVVFRNMSGVFEKWNISSTSLSVDRPTGKRAVMSLDRRFDEWSQDMGQQTVKHKGNQPIESYTQRLTKRVMYTKTSIKTLNWHKENLLTVPFLFVLFIKLFFVLFVRHNYSHTRVISCNTFAATLRKYGRRISIWCFNLFGVVIVVTSQN